MNWLRSQIYGGVSHAVVWGEAVPNSSYYLQSLLIIMVSCIKNNYGLNILLEVFLNFLLWCPCQPVEVRISNYPHASDEETRPYRAK